MNVAIIVGCLYSGGAERVAGLLSKYLADKYSVYLFLENVDNVTYEYGGTIVDIGINGEAYVEYYIDLYKKKYFIDCTISFMEKYNFLNVRTRQRDKVILSEHCFQSLMEPHEYYDEIMLKRYYGKADAVIAVADGIKQEMVNCFGLDGEKISTIYNFFDANEIKIKAKVQESNIVEESFYKGKRLIVNIGRVVEQKNQKKLLFQFADLYSRDKDVRLAIIGSGPMQTELEDTIKELSLDEVVRICPYCKNPFLLLRHAEVFVLASRYEGWGLVLLEAMSLEVPVISVDCPVGPREIICGNSNYNEEIKEWIAYERGILVTANESENEGETLFLSQAMEFCLNNSEYTQKAKKAGLKYISNYSNEMILNQWIEVIERTEAATENKVIEEVCTCKKNVVYGAGDIGKKVVKQLLQEGKEVYAVVVSEPQNNPTEILGIPVKGTELLMKRKNELNVYMGVSYLYINEVCHKILECGIAPDSIMAIRCIPD